MEVLRLYDPDRRPASWLACVRPGQFVAFTSRLGHGAACDFDGRPFETPGTESCVVFESIEDARVACETQARARPDLRFDVFDAEGRVNPPLLTIVAPSSERLLDDSPEQLRRRGRLALLLAVTGLALVAIDALQRGLYTRFIGIIVGFNMLLAAGRLALMTVSARERERTRRARAEAARR